MSMCMGSATPASIFSLGGIRVPYDAVTTAVWAQGILNVVGNRATSTGKAGNNCSHCLYASFGCMGVECVIALVRTSYNVLQTQRSPSPVVGLGRRWGRRL